MARFLSEAWFDEIESACLEVADSRDLGSATDTDERLVLKQVVTGTPDGEVSYAVVIEGTGARIERRRGPDGSADADLTITCDWPTASAIAQGRLSTQRALMQGQLRVRGSPTEFLRRRGQLANLDVVPPEVRQNTTY
jgi:SCP-2 sterol transfer family protein